jgi:hypothetical protein
MGVPSTVQVRTPDAVKDFLVGIVLMGRRLQFLPGRDEHLEHGDAAVAIIAGQKEADP